MAAVARHPNFCVVKSAFVCEFIWRSSITILSPGNGWTLVRPPLGRARPGWAGPGGRRAWPGGKVTTGEEPRGAEASGERHAPQRVATLSFELWSFFVFYVFFDFCNCVGFSMFPTFPFCVVRFLVVRVCSTFSELSRRSGFPKFARIPSFLGLRNCFRYSQFFQTCKTH